MPLDFGDDEDSKINLLDGDSDGDDVLSLLEDSDNEDLVSLDGDVPDGLIEYDVSDKEAHVGEAKRRRLIQTDGEDKMVA